MSAFLKAEWRNLVMANYVVDPALLSDYLPAYTEIDRWNDRCYISLVGFMFVNTRVLCIKIPFHINFEEVNLRFYVRHQSEGEWKRGVVFIKEIVPRSALTFIANTLYHEHYETMPMNHVWEKASGKLHVEYSWKKSKWNKFKVTSSASLEEIAIGSEEEFITEHYWGYTKVDPSKTLEYKVEHPRWQIHPMIKYAIDVDFGRVYGDQFAFLEREKPRSVFLAQGSEIIVNKANYVTGSKIIS